MPFCITWGRAATTGPTICSQQTRVLEWQFFEQYTHEPSIAVARFIKLYQAMPADRQEEYNAKLKAGYRALAGDGKSPAGNSDYLATDRVSLADISLYAYTHVAYRRRL